MVLVGTEGTFSWVDNLVGVDGVGVLSCAVGTGAGGCTFVVGAGRCVDVPDDDAEGGGTVNTRGAEAGAGATGTDLTRVEGTVAEGTCTGLIRAEDTEDCIAGANDVGILLCWLGWTDEVVAGRWRRGVTSCGCTLVEFLLSSGFDSVGTDGVGISECVGLLLLTDFTSDALGVAENCDAILFTELTLGWLNGDKGDANELVVFSSKGFCSGNGCFT